MPGFGDFFSGLGDTLVNILETPVGQELASAGIDALRREIGLVPSQGPLVVSGGPRDLRPMGPSPFDDLLMLEPTSSGVAGGGGSMPGSVTLFRPSGGTVRSRSLIIAAHPVTGEPRFFGHKGRPILFAGDIAAAKRVKKVGAMARRLTGGR